MDNLDKQVILELQENGRKSYVEIVKKLGISERTVRNRTSELVKNKIIKISAIPNLEAFGFHFVAVIAFQVQLPLLGETARKLTANKHIVLLIRVTGRYDLIAIIATRTLKEYGEIMDDIFQECPGIGRTETFSKISSYKGEVGDLDTSTLIETITVPSSKRYKL